MHMYIRMYAHIHTPTSYRTMHICIHAHMHTVTDGWLFAGQLKQKRKWKSEILHFKDNRKWEITEFKVCVIDPTHYVLTPHTHNTHIPYQSDGPQCTVFHLYQYLPPIHTQSSNEDHNNMVKSSPLSTCTVGTYLHHLQSITEGI